VPKEYRKNISFQAGELSPRFLGRSDTDIYAKGLAIAENVTVDMRGGAFKRGGLQHVARLPGNNGRLFTLQVSRTRYYTIVIYYDLDLDKGQMLILAPGARVLGNNLLSNGNFSAAGASWTSLVEPISSRVVYGIGEAELLPEQDNPDAVVNGNFQQEGLNWIVREDPAASVVSFSVGQCSMVPRGVAGDFAGISQELTGTPNASYNLIINGDFGGETIIKMGTAEGDGTYLDTTITNLSSGDQFPFTPTASPFWVTIDCVSTEGVYATLDSVEVKEQITKTAAISQMATVTAAITDLHLVTIAQAGVERLSVLIGTTAGASDIAAFESSAQEITETFVPNSATYWVTVLADGDNIEKASINLVGTAAEGDVDPLGIRMDAPWNEAQVDEIHQIQVPSGKTIYFTHPNVPTQKLIYDHALDVFVPLQAVSFLNPPAQWTGINHPSTGCHFQGRLWLGGTPDQGQTVWASKSGSPEDFTVDDPITDASALEFTLQEFGRIEWMLGTKNVLIGADNGEHIITSAGGIITSQDFQIDQQSSYGSNNMQALQVGEKVFYLTPDGRKLRAMAYEWQENNWISTDLTFASEHITAGIGKHSCWAQNPESIFLLELEDGTLASLTYDRTAETNAWTRLIAPGMQIKDIATGRRDGVNEIVAMGQRYPSTIDVETNSANKQKLDSYVSVFDPIGTNIITGLDHLEGETVRPMVDGAVNPLVVVTGGQVTTQQAGFQLYAGIPYTATIKTLPPDIPQSQIRSWKKRWNKVWALMYESKAPIINGTRPPARTPSTPMDTVEPDISGHYKTINLGWDDFGQITISEDLPVNMNVLAIYGEMGTETLK